MTEARRKRIELERERLHLRPWQLAPSEVFGRGESPYASTPNCAGHMAWIEAQRWVCEILAEHPRYFDDA